MRNDRSVSNCIPGSPAQENASSKPPTSRKASRRTRSGPILTPATNMNAAPEAALESPGVSSVDLSFAAIVVGTRYGIGLHGSTPHDTLSAIFLNGTWSNPICPPISPSRGKIEKRPSPVRSQADVGGRQ
eukprot:scaffold224512_cov35-Tisochrysis_lutea.AAC.6